MEHLLGNLLLMTVNQNRLKISLRGDISLQVRHIPLPYFDDFVIPTNSGLIAENGFPRVKNSKIFGPHFVKTWICPRKRVSVSEHKTIQNCKLEQLRPSSLKN